MPLNLSLIANFILLETLRIHFDNNVRVTRTSLDRFDFMESLNLLGSNLGLWPGLGLYQIMEGVLGILIANISCLTLLRVSRNQ